MRKMCSYVCIGNKNLYQIQIDYYRYLILYKLDHLVKKAPVRRSSWLRTSEKDGTVEI